MKKYSVLLVLLASLTGCSTIYQHQYFVRNHDRDYLQARSLPPLKTPVGVSGAAIGDAYPVPGVNRATPLPPISLVPPGSLATAQLAAGKK